MNTRQTRQTELKFARYYTCLSTCDKLGAYRYTMLDRFGFLNGRQFIFERGTLDEPRCRIFFNSSQKFYGSIIHVAPATQPALIALLEHLQLAKIDTNRGGGGGGGEITWQTQTRTSVFQASKIFNVLFEVFCTTWVFDSILIYNNESTQKKDPVMWPKIPLATPLHVYNAHVFVQKLTEIHNRFGVRRFAVDAIESPVAKIIQANISSNITFTLYGGLRPWL